MPVTPQHGAGGHIDRRQSGADGSHQQRWRCLIATAHQNRAIDRLRMEIFFHFHREQVAIQHSRWLHEILRQSHHRDFDRKSSGLQHAAFHVLHAIRKMCMAVCKSAPRVDDRDNRLSLEVLLRVAHLLHARTMAERAHVIRTEPSVAP